MNIIYIHFFSILLKIYLFFILLNYLFIYLIIIMNNQLFKRNIISIYRFLFLFSINILRFSLRKPCLRGLQFPALLGWQGGDL